MQRREVQTAAEKKTGVAAFFDLDGTLIPLPSLEQRFFRFLRYQHAIPTRNYWAWLKESLRLLPHGISLVGHSNKMYLRDVRIPARRDPRWHVPTFFPAAFQRAAWHAWQGDAILLVSGTLEPLALAAAKRLDAGLQLLGVAVQIRVCATHLEEVHGQWTGKIEGEAMFGEAKARAVRQVAQEMQLDLTKCWAYGDTVHDRWMLAAVGHPVVVNPSRKLARLAHLYGWPVQHWAQRTNLMEKNPSSQKEGATAEDCQIETGRQARGGILADGPTERLRAGVARSGSLG